MALWCLYLMGTFLEYQETMANETNIEQMFITLQPFMLWITPSEKKEKKSEDRDPLLS